MLTAMMNAEVGDDVFGQDPSVNELEQKVSEMFGKEAALFCPSGTMTNQIAIQLHTGRLEEVICDRTSHVFQYETGGYAYNGGVAIKLLDGENGKINVRLIKQAINPDYEWLPASSLVVIENTCNKGGGSFYTLEEIEPISRYCLQQGLKMHLDGARLFNALVETGESPQEWGKHFDTISICLSKGLGAPVGSVLTGSSEMIKQARRLRKVMGGGMRQAGYLAAAGIYALENHIDRLSEDNRRTKTIAEKLSSLSFVENIRPVRTNILIFDVISPLDSNTFLEKLSRKGILAAPFGPQTVRFVTHLDFTESMLEALLVSLDELDPN